MSFKLHYFSTGTKKNDFSRAMHRQIKYTLLIYKESFPSRIGVYHNYCQYCDAQAQAVYVYMVFSFKCRCFLTVTHKPTTANYLQGHETMMI